jgi:hypothetical protein
MASSRPSPKEKAISTQGLLFEKTFYKNYSLQSGSF